MVRVYTELPSEAAWRLLVSLLRVLIPSLECGALWCERRAFSSQLLAVPGFLLWHSHHQQGGEAWALPLPEDQLWGSLSAGLSRSPSPQPPRLPRDVVRFRREEVVFLGSCHLASTPPLLCAPSSGLAPSLGGVSVA